MKNTALIAIIAVIAVAVIAAAAFAFMSGSSGDNKESPDEPQTYTVTFDSRGGSGVPAQTVKAGARASEPAAPVLADRVFEGWYTSADGGTRFDFGSAVTGNITLYARWTDDYKLIYTKSDFASIQSSAGARYRLMNDISLGEWKEPLHTWFRGVLDGNGHEISYSFSGTASWSKAVTEAGTGGYSYGLLGNLDGAEIRDLKVRASVVMDIPYSTAEIDAGIIAGSALGGSITGCTADGTFYLKSGLSANCFIYAGGLVGKTVKEALSVRDCTVGASVAANGMSVSIGGAVGYANSPVNAEGFAMSGEITGLGGKIYVPAIGTVRSVANVGGVIGYSGGSSSSGNAVIATENVKVIRTAHIGNDTSHQNSDPECHIGSIGNGTIAVSGGSNIDLSGNLGPYDETYKGISWNG